MYQAHWKLKQKPFENTSEARFYYPSETHQAALLKLRYAIENRSEAALLVGGAGVGKSLLMAALRRQLPPEVTPLVHLVFPLLPPAELVSYLAWNLAQRTTGATPTAGIWTLEESLRQIEQILTHNVECGQHTVVAVDEAHLIAAEPQSLEALRLLLNFEVQEQRPLTLLLLGQTDLLPALERMPELEQRLAVKCLVRSLSVDSTAGYVTHRLTTAGAEEPIFTPEALETIHALTGGNPRQINRLCDLALLIGFAEERQTIDAPHIEAVAEELVMPTGTC